MFIWLLQPQHVSVIPFDSLLKWKSMLTPHDNVAPTPLAPKMYFFNKSIFIKEAPNKILGTCSVRDCVQIGGKI